MIGRTIDRYQVIEQLGQGGMGVVYKARDTLLDRFVALKVLPPSGSLDPERRRRFLQEARAASALNHPGIVSVYDVLTVDGEDILVMELVEGETLESLLARRRLALGEALGLAARIADALARAHAAGIVHRDLKPGNVMVTADGVKVLDFGLAKLIESPFADAESPTMSPAGVALTRERVIMGTAGWMSPEQASGGPVDARSDVFAFGVLLYEMLTGRQPFRRATTVETLAAIRDDEPPPPSRLVPSLPPEIDRAVLRCLRKEPAKRWQSLSDLAAVLEDLKDDSESGRRVIVEAAGSRRARSRWWLPAAIVAAGIAAVAGVLLLRRAPTAPEPLDMRRLTYDAGFAWTPAITLDGKLVAYASDRAGDGQLDVWVRHISRPEPARLTDHPTDDWMPAFSPDGSRIVFSSDRDGGGLYIVNTFGGEARRLASHGMSPRFAPDGARISFVATADYTPSGLRRMFVIAADGGEPRPLLPEYGILAYPYSAGPLWSPDGTRLLFAGAPLASPAKLDWWVASADGGEPTSSGAMESLPAIDVLRYPCAWLPGRVLFAAGSTIEGVNIYSASITPEGRIAGPVQVLSSGPGMTMTPSVSADGRIAIDRFQWVLRLWRQELDDRGGAIGEPRQVTPDAAPKFHFSLTRDGSRLAFSTFSGPRESRLTEVRLRDLASGHEAVLVSAPAAVTSLRPRISPDGTLVAWSDLVDRQRVAYVAPVDEPIGRELCRSCTVVGFFADGAEALVHQFPDRLVRHRLADGAKSLVLDAGELTIVDADLSWDDRWLAVSSARPDGRTAVHLVPVSDPPAPPGEWIDLADGTAFVGSPRWSPDGRLLYYLSDRDGFNCMWARPLDPVTRRPAGEPFAVLHAHRSDMKMLRPEKSWFSLAVGRGRLVFNAAETTGEIYTAMLEPASN
ncbi:MAG TPA: protein kinase [Thermoanaerobaculales bacterium]|nr:protein kinase [Thermoanaerobaculales bacterium]HQL29000.1 protein kinase [Thermoanaerobaculales bacterium]